MYKLLLVDDEEEVRKGMLKKLDWANYGFSVVGEAENGRDAFEIAEKVIPDVVITDIKMPFMDGIRLTELLRERFPTIKIVLLTGFEEFEFAQKAIRLNVLEYVLKPISSIDLIEVLQRIKLALDTEFSQKEDLQALRAHYKQSLPIMREKFLSSLISRSMPLSEIYKTMELLGLSICGTNHMVSVISIDLNSQVDEIQSVFKVSEDLELLKFAIYNISDEIVERYNLGQTFIHEDNIVIITSTNHKPELLKHITFSLLEEIRQSTEKFIKYTVTIGTGSICNDLTQLHISYGYALNAIDYRMTLGRNRIIYIEDVESQNTKYIKFDEQKERNLYSLIKVGTNEELKQAIEAIFVQILDTKASIKEYQIFLLEILTTVLRAAKDSSIEVDEIFGTNSNIFTYMYKLNTLSEAKEWMENICTKIMSKISKERQDNCKYMVECAKEYMQNHYFESDLTIEKVCGYLHISPNYFSTIFKKETKINFINYLTQIRMDAAKKLLRTTSMKMLEIAQEVGYSESNYFSYCFKKNMLISPSEYRNG